VRDVPLRTPANALVSFHYFAESDMAELASWGLRIIGDSGAYSAASQGTHIDRDKFYGWARQWRHCLLWVAGLDVIGDDDATWKNWVNAPSDLRLVPTVHYGVPGSAIDKYVEAGADLIGLGGMVPYKSEPERLLRWCAQMMKYARDRHPHVRFHGWGVTHPALMMKLPWWSVDSSGYASAFRYGTMALVDPDVVPFRRFQVKLNGRDIAPHAALLRKHYGLQDWSRVAVSNRDTRRDVGRVAVRTYQLMEDYLRRRYQVTSPQSLAVDSPGPHVHAVQFNTIDEDGLRPLPEQENS